jgi:hypothetical protein
MSDLDKLVEEWLNSRKGQQKLRMLGLGAGTKQQAQQYANQLRGYLRETTSNLISNYGNAFIDFLNVRVYQESGKWCADVYFDEAAVTQDSLYPAKYAPRYLPAIINNPWKTGVNTRMGGYNRHGDFVHATNDYQLGEYKHFIQKSVQRFENEVGVNVRVQISPIFK